MTFRERCEQHGKDIYRSYGAAMSAASNCQTKRDVILRVYYDSTCSSYHITSKVDFTYQEMSA